MQGKDLAKHIALWSCVYYTAATFFILFLYFLLNADLSGGLKAMALIAILLTTTRKTGKRKEAEGDA